MIKKFSQRRTTIGSSCLFPIYSIQRLINKKATCTSNICPWRCLWNKIRKARLLRHINYYGWLIYFCLQAFYLHSPEKYSWLKALGEKIQERHNEIHFETIWIVKELNALLTRGAQARRWISTSQGHYRKPMKD